MVYKLKDFSSYKLSKPWIIIGRFFQPFFPIFFGVFRFFDMTVFFSAACCASLHEDNVLVFRLPEHVDRMMRNMEILCMEIPETREDIERICVELIRRSNFKEGVYIRPIIYKSAHSLGPTLRGVESRLCCYVIKLGDYVDIGITAGITLGRERRTRLYAKVQNVTNDEYSTVVGYYDAGRRVSAGVQHSF